MKIALPTLGIYFHVWMQKALKHARTGLVFPKKHTLAG